MVENLIILVILLLLSAFFSSTELAFIVSNKLKIEVKARKKNFAAQSAYHFVKDNQDFYSTILIGNNIVNVAFASLATVLLADYMGWNEYEILFAITIVTLIFGELLPKFVAREDADSFILIFSIPLRIISFIISPLTKITKQLLKLLTEKKQEAAQNITRLFDKDDFIILIDEGHRAGKFKKEESNIITKVFDFTEQKVYEAMRPRTEITGIELSSSIKDAVNLFIESGYSKLIVYEENLDNIKGVILAKDMFSNPSDIKSATREIPFYPETKKSLEILNEFLNSNVSIAVVVDEFGGTAGIVTMEDIIEELFGEISDEYDIEETICRKVSKDSFILSGKVEIDHINDKYDLNFPIGDYETIAGFIIEKLGYIPKSNETVTIDNYKFLIIRANKVKIDIVKLTLKKDDQSE
ncbi:MAG: hemolysin family protein [Ignavibacteriaceae bacterium]